MNIEEINDHLEYFQTVMEKSLKHENQYRNSSTKKLRADGLQNLQSEISYFSNYVESKPHLYDLITAPEGSDYHKNIIWEEFCSVQYFGRDLKNSIGKLKNLKK